MMTYVDGYLIPVPKVNRDLYAKMAQVGAKVFMDHGAQQVVENWADDVPHGASTDFYMSVKANEDEDIVFSWIIWPSKEARDSGNAAAMEDERFKEWEGVTVFDGKRMIFGGFTTIVDSKA